MCTVFTNQQTKPHTQSTQTKPTVHTQSTQTTPTVPRAIWPNETVGAVPVCPPERPRSGVSIPKIHAWCAGDNRWMHPCRATRAGTQAPPLPISIIFVHANKITICTQSTLNDTNHPCAIHPNETNHPRVICSNDTNRPTPNLAKRNQPFAYNPSKRNRRGGAYVPARTSA